MYQPKPEMTAEQYREYRNRQLKTCAIHHVLDKGIGYIILIVSFVYLSQVWGIRNTIIELNDQDLFQAKVIMVLLYGIFFVIFTLGLSALRSRKAF